MKKYCVVISKILLLLFVSVPLFSQQKIGFINTKMIREKLPDAKLAEQRCQTMVDEWKRELKSMEDKEEALQFEISKNRLVWSDAEKQKADKELKDLQTKRLKYANEKFSQSTYNEYDKIVEDIMRPVEEKIFATVQEVAAKERYDFIWDQSTMPLPYVNFKYDITLKVLKALGVDVSTEEAEQQKKIDSDARNDEDRRKAASQTPRGRSRGEKAQPTMQVPVQEANPTLNPIEMKEPERLRPQGE
ncbi:MAG: OmpH family outer membrane protein [Bacteroidetes bacterium]|nr:OmpH family outer membrane protein [Bacteroidota bacterium]